jgi:hypothetical protein
MKRPPLLTDNCEIGATLAPIFIGGWFPSEGSEWSRNSKVHVQKTVGACFNTERKAGRSHFRLLVNNARKSDRPYSLMNFAVEDIPARV